MPSKSQIPLLMTLYPQSNMFWEPHQEEQERGQGP